MKRSIIVFVLLFVCVGCDQGTKYTAKHYLAGRQTLSYMGDTVRLGYAENMGAFLSVGAGMPEKLRITVLVGLTSVFLVGFLLFVLGSRNMNLPTTAASALIIGGGLGNLFDRIINKGAVMDFMNIGIGPLRTGIFNGADVFIMAGVLLLASLLCRREV